MGFLRSSPKPPDPPDLAGAARAQGEANKETAFLTNVMSNPNYNNPYGTRRITYGPMQTGGEASGAAGGSITVQGPNGPITIPSGSYGGWQAGSGGGVGVGGNVVPTITDEFSPTEQAKYDAESQAILGMYDVGLAGLDRVGNTMADQFQPDPNWQQYQTFEAPETAGYGRGDLENQMMEFGTRGKLPGVDQLTTDGLSGFGDYSSMSGLGDYSVGGYEAVADAIRQLGGSRLDQERSGLEADLAARGFTPGTQGYDDALRAMGQKENDFDLQAFLAAGAEQSRMNQGLASNYMTAGAEQSRVNQGLAANREQAFGENKDIYTAQDADYQREFARREWSHREAQNRRNQEISERNNDFRNQLSALSAQQGASRDAATIRQNQLQEAAYFRNQPLAELNSLIRGSPASMPQFQQFTGSTVTPPPLYQAAADQGAWDLENYANQPDRIGQLFELGGAALPFLIPPSDLRLKTNIKRIGRVGGLDLVSWDWNGMLGLKGRSTGFIAQQVQRVYPEFVKTIKGGYLGIDYNGLSRALK